jgi:hypothetical protein
MNNEIVIDENNFHQYFRNTRKSRKQKNDIVVMYFSSAVFVDGKLKEEVIDLLCYEFNSVNKCIGKLFKYAYAPQREAIRLCKEIIKDFNNGISRDEIVRKEYPFFLQMFFYTKDDYVPKNDKRWVVISDEFRKNNTNIPALQGKNK